MRAGDEPHEGGGAVGDLSAIRALREEGEGMACPQLSSTGAGYSETPTHRRHFLNDSIRSFQSNSFHGALQDKESSTLLRHFCSGRGTWSWQQDAHRFSLSVHAPFNEVRLYSQNRRLATLTSARPNSVPVGKASPPASLARPRVGDPGGRPRGRP